MSNREVKDSSEKPSQSKDSNFDRRHASFKPGGETKTEASEKQSQSREGAFDKRHASFKPGEISEVDKTAEPKRPGSGDIPEAQILSKAGEQPFRNELTRAGHSFQEHGNRTSGIWEQPKGNPEELSKRGQANLDRIINAKDTQWETRHHARFGSIVEGHLPDGRGARWSADGKTFHGFLDP